MICTLFHGVIKVTCVLDPQTSIFGLLDKYHMDVSLQELYYMRDCCLKISFAQGTSYRWQTMTASWSRVGESGSEVTETVQSWSSMTVVWKGCCQDCIRCSVPPSHKAILVATSTRSWHDYHIMDSWIHWQQGDLLLWTNMESRGPMIMIIQWIGERDLGECHSSRGTCKVCPDLSCDNGSSLAY
jgi:hypothetical protein